jgi:serine/threonine protein kinase/tetratricopeptide (TPR) repeat protein
MANPAIDEKAIFTRAREIAAPQERLAYLRVACGDDPAAMQRMLELLRVYDQESSFLESSPIAREATVDLPISERPGTVIGPYKLLEQIGEGGFGVVFLAEQQEPVHRKVALKVLKPGMDTRQVVARFEAERQALAIMDHANIAKVYDGGATPAGRPYFVMELVKGVPITDFCDQNHLTPRQRLELFIPICQAIQHAHQKGIIHRDLKPTNVLVSQHDTTPVAKVIDFGVAKALGEELTEKTLFTSVAQMVGTPLYMSPEQAGMSDLDVDTRSDIYSLGVLLYELLTGTTPFSQQRFRQASFDEIRRIIREEEPPRPSTRLSDSKVPLPSISAQRHTEPAKLTRLVRGELDWIVMKALEKDRNRRYETANDLSTDIRHYLADEPVQACPPSAAYCMRKFLCRRRGPVLAAALVLLALLGGFVGTTLGLLQARASAQAARLATEEAQAKQALAEASAAAEHIARQAEAEQRLKADAAEAKVKQGQLELSQKIALVQKSLEHQQALVIYVTSYTNRMAALEREGAIVRDIVTQSEQRLSVERAKLAELETELFNQREVERRQKLLGVDHPDTLASVAHLGAVYERAGRWADAEGVYTELAALQRRKGPADNPELAGVQARLARCLLRQKKYTDAEALLREVLKNRPKTQAGDWLFDDTRSMLGESLLGQKKYTEAEPLLLRGYEGMKQRATAVPTAEQVRLVEVLDQLVQLYDAMGRKDKADEWHRKVQDAVLGPKPGNR